MNNIHLILLSSSNYLYIWWTLLSNHHVFTWKYSVYANMVIMKMSRMVIMKGWLGDSHQPLTTHQQPLITLHSKFRPGSKSWLLLHRPISKLQLWQPSMQKGEISHAFLNHRWFHLMRVLSSLCQVQHTIKWVPKILWLLDGMLWLNQNCIVFVVPVLWLIRILPSQSQPNYGHYY